MHVNVGGKNTDVQFLSRDALTLYPFADASICVCDEHTERIEGIPERRVVVLPAGEEHKSILSVQRILDAALETGLARDSSFIAFGGGVVCDMTAFAASIYMRGAPLTLIPTTLLSMVDASIGGKTGIDYGGCKNIVGTFYPAEVVIICIELLFSLPEPEYRSGLAEVLKHGLLKGGQLLSLLEEKREAILAREPDILHEVIFRSLTVKKEYIEADPFEVGVRSHLNLGHTFAHGLESSLRFSGVSHGDAVAWGIARAMETGLALGITDRAYAARVSKLLASYGFRLSYPEAERSVIMSAMQHDKKKREGQVRFVLQKAEADTLTMPVPDNVLESVFKDMK